jgi:hypothetical protein
MSAGPVTRWSIDIARNLFVEVNGRERLAVNGVEGQLLKVECEWIRTSHVNDLERGGRGW